MKRIPKIEKVKKDIDKLRAKIIESNDIVKLCHTIKENPSLEPHTLLLLSLLDDELETKIIESLREIALKSLDLMELVQENLYKDINKLEGKD